MEVIKEMSVVFTDGASKGNPGPGGWGAIAIISDDSGTHVTELGGREENVTNNQMELRGAIEALRHLSLSEIDLLIYTDSSYLINGITKWLSAWRMNEWKTKNKKVVLNRELWEELAELTENKNIQWKYVGGHSGIVGNERADVIATEFAEGKRPKLFSRPLKEYGMDILNIDLDESKATEKTAARRHSKAAAYSYVSLVDDKIETHQNWKDCEARVKGKSGARFKKVVSKEEEGSVIQQFSN